MTIREALKDVVVFDVSDTSLDKALEDAGLTGADTYIAGNKKEVDLAALPLLRRLIIKADITEGGYSIKYDRSAILKLIAGIESEYEITDAGNAVRSGDFW